MLRKLILASVLAGTFIVPALAAREPNATRALKRVLLYWALFGLAYAFAVIVVYHRV